MTQRTRHRATARHLVPRWPDRSTRIASSMRSRIGSAVSPSGPRGASNLEVPHMFDPVKLAPPARRCLVAFLVAVPASSGVGGDPRRHLAIRSPRPTPTLRDFPAACEDDLAGCAGRLAAGGIGRPVSCRHLDRDAGARGRTSSTCRRLQDRLHDRPRSPYILVWADASISDQAIDRAVSEPDPDAGRGRGLDRVRDDPSGLGRD